MNRWHAMLEYVQFPLKVLFFAILLLGIGNTIINPNVTYLWDIHHKAIILISEIMRYSGGFLIRIFPLLVFLVLLTRKFEDSVPVFLGFGSYIIISMIILFLENTNAASYFYGNYLGIQISFDAESMFGQVVRIPYNTGIFSLIAAYLITTHCYLKSRHYSMHGVLSFIDHDAWAMIINFFYSIIVGVLFAFGWPFIIQAITTLYEYLGDDLTNPMNLFLYGIMERVSAVFGLQDLPRNAFWLGELGGTATDNFGVLFSGDIGTWYAMQNFQIVTTNAGHLITPYYVINIFLIPGFLLGYYSMVQEKRDRHRYLLFFLLAIALSIACGNPLPMEIFMLVLAPLLYFFYLLIVGFLYAGFQILGVAIGYWFEGSLLVANPGSLVDLFPFFRSPDKISALSAIIVLGTITFFLFFIATRSYFKRFAMGVFNAKRSSSNIGDHVIDALGGLKNIQSVASTPDKLTVGLYHREKVNFEALKKEGAYLILESKEGYLIRLGNISTIIAKEIKQKLETMEQEEQG